MTIDWWTLGLQTVDIVILIWLLGRFFWRPVAGMIEQRRVTAQKTLSDAEAKRAQAVADLAEIKATRAGFAQEREAILTAAREAAEKARDERLMQVESEITAREASAQAQLAAHRAEAETAWAGQASQLAVEIAGRLAARLDGAAVRAAFLQWLLDEIRNLPESQRKSVAMGGVALKAVSATPLDAGEQASYRKLIAEAFGTKPKIDFTTDPALIAGLELRGPHFVVTNSWRADLAKILVDITHAKA